jgi:hypothetical protein
MPSPGRASRAGLLLVVLLLGACGVEPQRSPEPVPVDRLPPATAAATGAPAAQGRVWGARGSRLVPVFVELRDTRVDGRVRALLALAEPGQRPPTAVPPRTRLVGVDRSGGTVVLDFSEELGRVPDTSLPLALGQIVFTVTEDPAVRRVHVRSDDDPVRYLDATGRRISRPLVRADFAPLVATNDDGPS